jgi:hypothetical protein
MGELMKLLGLFPILALFLGVAAAGADEISIPFPTLTGVYDTRFDIPPNGGVFSRTVTFEFPPEIEHIENIRLVMSGEWHVGSQVCFIDWEHVTSPYNPPMSVSLHYGEEPLHSFGGYYNAEDGAFSSADVALDFCCGSDPDPYDRLLDGPVEIWVGCCQNGPECTPTIDAYGTLTDVHLEITGSVATEGRTWGTLKALYR